MKIPALVLKAIANRDKAANPALANNGCIDVYCDQGIKVAVRSDMINR